MTANPLHSVLEKFLSRQAYLQGLALHFETYLKKYAQENIPGSFHPKFDFILGTNLIISDLSGETDNGGAKKFSTGKYYGLHHSNKEQKENELLIDFFGFLIVQSYESLESFIKAILITHFDHNLNDFIKCGFLKTKSPLKEINNLRTKNNSEYIELMCKISDGFKLALNENNRGLNLSNWFEHFSRVRHSITHKARRFENSDFSKIKKSERDKLRRFFPTQKSNNSIKYYFTISNLDYIITVASEFGFAMFKFLSIAGDHEWKYAINMK